MPEFRGDLPKKEEKKEEIPESLEDTQPVHVVEIGDGGNAKNLKESLRFFELASGDKVLVGTDKGIGYSEINQDRWVVFPGDNFAAVIDGMGGYDQGDVAAEILAKSLISVKDINVAVEQAQKEMKEVKIGEGGAVFIAARIFDRKSGGKTVEIAQAGDAKAIIITRDGRRKLFESEDQSPLQDLVNEGSITADEVLYHSRRNLVKNSVSPYRECQSRFYSEQYVNSGDLVLLMSDGISDNITADEIEKKVKEGLSAEELFAWLSEATDARMKFAEKMSGLNDMEKKAVLASRRAYGRFGDGYKSMPKKDNRALVIIEIK